MKFSTVTQANMGPTFTTTVEILSVREGDQGLGDWIRCASIRLESSSIVNPLRCWHLGLICQLHPFRGLRQLDSPDSWPRGFD
jgi:hypothetical protein